MQQTIKLRRSVDLIIGDLALLITIFFIHRPSFSEPSWDYAYFIILFLIAMLVFAIISYINKIILISADHFISRNFFRQEERVDFYEIFAVAITKKGQAVAIMLKDGSLLTFNESQFAGISALLRKIKLNMKYSEIDLAYKIESSPDDVYNRNTIYVILNVEYELKEALQTLQIAADTHGRRAFKYEFSKMMELGLNTKHEVKSVNRGDSYVGIQIIISTIIFLAVILIALLFDRWLLSEAQTAIETLHGYLIYYRALIWGVSLGVTLLLITNLLIIRMAKKAGDFAKKHVITMVVALAIFMIPLLGIIVEEDSLTTLRYVEADIIAIENEEFVVDYFLISLTWENYYRMLPLRNAGEYRPFYVVRFDNIGRVYFPKSLSPSILKEMAAGDEYQLYGHHENSRIFRIWLTPNLQVAYAVMPIRN